MALNITLSLRLCWISRQEAGFKGSYPPWGRGHSTYVDQCGVGKYTSWSEYAGHYGVVLVHTFKMGSLFPSPDAFNEQEILVPGMVKAQVFWNKYT
jgi:hypothetical protein